jgi:hypothetical protein
MAFQWRILKSSGKFEFEVRRVVGISRARVT